MADSLYWVWLAESIGAGSKAYGPLLERFGSAYEIYRADEEELYKIPDVSERELVRLCDKNLDAAQKIVDYCTRSGVGILTYDGEKFPKRLKTIRNSPVVIYYKGRLPDFDRRLCIAVVGTRKTTEYGEQTAYKMGYELAYAGAVVVSGMALGADGIAACGALEAHGVTCAVLGCGIDVVYPRDHKRLMDRIIEHGAVMTEFSPGTPPAGYHFPIRNRIISGLCQGTLVIEADVKSGALITANEALYQGRDVYALPGNINGVNSEGTNKLIKEGAKIVTRADDIIAEYEFLYSDSISYERLKHAKESSFFDRGTLERYGVRSRYPTPEKKENTLPPERKEEKHTATETGPEKKPKKRFGGVLKKKNEPDTSMLDDVCRAVYEIMPDGASVSADVLAGSGVPAKDIMSALTILEINGFICALPGGLYVKI